MCPNYFITITYNGDGNFFISKNAIDADLGFELDNESRNFTIHPSFVSNAAPTFLLKFKISFTETENFKACSVNITVTA